MKSLKILYIMHYLDYDIQHQIVNYLRSKNLHVDMHLICQKGEEFPGQRILTDTVFELLKKADYDFIFCNTHSTWLCEKMIKKLVYDDGKEEILETFEDGLFGAVKPRFGYVDIEHDLFTPIPEHFPKSFVVSFHQRHYDYCVQNNIQTIKCRWPKLDIEFPAREKLVVDRNREAVLIASNAYLEEAKTKPVKLFGFKNLWFKKHFSESFVPKGLKELPSYFDGHLGIKYCIDNFKFIITPISSCFIEALLFDRVPIMLPNQIVSEKKLDSLVSLVEVKELTTFGEFINSYEVITTRNLNSKIKILKNNRICEEVIKRLRNQWWPDDSFSKLPLHRVLYNYVYSFLPR